MKRNFNISEILESIDIIVEDNKDKANDKKIIINKSKKFANKNIDISINPKTEKIIIDAEESLKNNFSENDNRKIEESPLILNNLESSNLDLSKPLLLEEYLLEEREKIEDHDLRESIIEEGNDVNELENNYIYESKLLKSKNTQQLEIIKDLNILLDDFKKQKRYSDLNNKLKLYQDDNTMLRKKIFNLNEIENNLRSRLSELTQNKKISEKK